MPRNGSGVYSLPAGSTFTPNTLIQSAVVNSINTDIATDMNTPRPIVAGGTGATTAAGAAAALNVFSTAQQITGNRNQIINGNFDWWQRGNTQSTSGYGSDDRWNNGNTGTTKTHSLQSFTVGQTAVPGNPSQFSRTVVTSVAGAANFCQKLQKIESVYTLQGQTATFTFYAKAGSAQNIAVEFIQNFGTGGSPSAQVTGIGVTTLALTTNWARYDVLVSIPSISGKTLGSTNNHFLGVLFWFDAGSSFNSRTNSLGQQSGTFDVAHVSLVQGDARTEADPFSQRHVQQELALCYRYFQIYPQVLCNGYNSTGNTVHTQLLIPAMRAAPSMVGLNATFNNTNTLAVSGTGVNWARPQVQITATGYGYCAFDMTLDAEL